MPLDKVGVLLVEDDADCANLVTTAAEVANVPFHFDFATNGLEALNFLRENGSASAPKRPGMVLLDLNLPVMSGRDVLAAMKKDADLRQIPVVLLSTTDVHGELKKEFGLTDNCCYSKPDRFRGYVELLERLERLYKQGDLAVTNF